MPWLLNIAKVGSLASGRCFFFFCYSRTLWHLQRGRQRLIFLEAGDMDGEMWFLQTIEITADFSFPFSSSCMFSLCCCEVDQVRRREKVKSVAFSE
jgi:hypothetical protein